MMVGRTIFEATPELPEHPDPEVVLEVRNLNRGRVIRDVSFQLHRGEILGIAGLVGAGRTEVVRAVFGADPRDSGEILVHGKAVAMRTPTDAVRHGIGYLSEDRKRFGLALPMDVEANVVLASLRRFTGRLGRIRFGRTRATAQEHVESLAIRRPASPSGSRTSRAGTSRRSSSPSGSPPTPRSSSSTSRPAASTSAPRARSTGSSTTSPSRARRSS
jgi:ribose transport system ATP-binding protein